MNWQNIKVSSDNTYFLFDGKPIFDKHYTEVLKFHSPGLAPVFDKTGAYHIDISGAAIYSKRYTRTFGYYCNRAAVVLNEEWFHIDNYTECEELEEYLGKNEDLLSSYKENMRKTVSEKELRCL